MFFNVNKLKKFRFRELGILVAFIILCIMFTIIEPRFGTLVNFLNLGRQISIIGILAIGMTFLIIGGNLDLSIGSMFAFTSTITAIMMVNGINPIIALLLGLILGGICGFINGVLTTFGRIPSFVVTLGMLNVYRGAQLIIIGAIPINVAVGVYGNVQSSKSADIFFFLGKGRLFDMIPMLFIIFLTLWLAGYIILRKTAFGFHTYAIGGSPEASYAAGINCKWVQTGGFILTGVLVAAASILQLAYLGTVTGRIGVGYELEAIAATIIGGTSFSGGVGTLAGTLIGAAIMGALRNGLVLVGVSTFWQILTMGIVIILAVALDVRTTRKIKLEN